MCRLCFVSSNAAVRCAALSHIWSVAGAVGSIAAAGTAFGLWLLLTNSFRMDRQMVITQVYRNVAESDITSALSSHVEDSMQAARSGSNSALDLARSGSNPDSNPARSGSIPNPLMSSMGYPVDRSFDPLDSSAGLIDNAILGAAVAAAGTMSRGESFGVSDDAKKVAKQITKRCLQRWDAPGGFRASTDSLGRKSGIWRDKFDGVRSATMLLAMRRFNNGLMGGYAGMILLNMVV